MMNSRARSLSSATVLVGALVAVSALSACAPLLLGGAAVSGALMVNDRRTSGTQVEDEAIELKASNRLRDALGDSAHWNVTSYNRVALITGEVATEAQRASVETTVSAIENVRSVVNETLVAGKSSLTSRSNDTLITSKIKATLIDAKDVQAQAIKVVTERSVVYLMGRVTEREATRAVELARGVGGVQKVVRVFEMLTEDELKNLQQVPAKK
jgi:osmotically-inducible protein OsmY